MIININVKTNDLNAFKSLTKNFMDINIVFIDLMLTNLFV